MNRLSKMSFFFSLMLAGCLLFSIASDAPGFITFQHEFGVDDYNTLIDKVHAPRWNISYAYGEDCPPEARNNDAALTAAVTKALQTWLQPLRDYTAKPIVNDFRYQRKADFNEIAGFAGDLWIIFYCERRNSNAHIGGNIPGISLRRGTKVVRHFMVSLVHEAGHVFGLADTYIPWGDRFKRGLSKGGLDGTKGTQPAAVMNGYMPVFPGAADDPVPPDGLETIGVDDINGILWLYKHIHEGLPLEDCFFPDYELEEVPHGCRPKYPLIFEIKQGDEYWALKVIEDDRNIEINAQDQDGLTALHHAVLNGFEELVATLIAHKDIKPFLRDKQGRSALKLARERRRDNIVALLLSHPLTLSVGAKGKLATTWGHLKQVD